MLKLKKFTVINFNFNDKNRQFNDTLYKFFILIIKKIRIGFNIKCI